MKLFRLILLIAAITLGAPTAILFAQTVTMGPIPGTSFCSGDPISVSFTATGTFGHKNAFTLQLSDPTGSFSSGFNNLGSVKDTIAGTFTIIGQIPQVTPTSKYRLRVLAAVPYLPSQDNGFDLTIGNVPPKPYIYWNSGSHSQDSYAAVGVTLRFSIIGDGTTVWNFGPSASKPWDSSSYPTDIVYSTGGRKTILVTSTSGCSRTDTLLIDVLDCTTPVIPPWAVVIDTDQTYRGNQSLWVNPGVTLSVTGDADTIFAEAGSKIKGSTTSLIYLKRGAQVQVNNGLSIHDTSTSFVDDNLLCPGLTFNYSKAPPNRAFHDGVFTSTASNAIKLSPNPTRGSVTISGLPKGISSMRIVNVFGVTVKELHPAGMFSIAVELSSLPAGSYFVRIESASSIFAKRLIKE